MTKFILQKLGLKFYPKSYQFWSIQNYVKNSQSIADKIIAIWASYVAQENLKKYYLPCFVWINLFWKTIFNQFASFLAIKLFLTFVGLHNRRTSIYFYQQLNQCFGELLIY